MAARGQDPSQVSRTASQQASTGDARTEAGSSTEFEATENIPIKEVFPKP